MNWPTTPDQIQKLYEDGFSGAPYNPIEKEKCFADGIVQEAIRIQHLVETNPGNGKRALLWRSREKYDPGAFEQESQTTGDCVSHGDRNARDVTRSVEIHIKGEAEEYFKRGATEPTYGARGHSGQGMDPYRASRFVTENGYMVRQNYEGVVNLTNYNGNIGARWGRSGPPQNVINLCKDHQVGEYVQPSDPDEAMALFNNGYAAHSGQNVGFSNTPNNKGIHDRRGSWNHDMASVGYDDTKDIWPVRVYFVPNSWGAFNQQWSVWKSDPEVQKILGPPINGMIVVHHEVWESYFLRGSMFYSDIEGFPTKTLPDYGTGEFL
jgi:hypothetical protein